MHVRNKHSSNRDLREMRKMTNNKNISKVNLNSTDGESIITNSAQIAALIKSLDCKRCNDVETALEKEVSESVNRTWSQEAEKFEQHIKEEDDIFRAWRCGEFETRTERCRACGQADVKTDNSPKMNVW